jgi:hypothetical protein
MSSGSVHQSDEASFICDAAMAKYIAVKNDTTVNQVTTCTANTDETVGFVQNVTTAASEQVTVRTDGYTMAVCSGGWTRGDKLTPTTAGALVTTTTAAHKVCAIAEDTVATGTNGEVRIISPAVRYDTF